jgi:uncharacterized membrane protein
MIHLAVITLLTSLALATPVLARPTLPFGVRVAAERVHDPAIVAQRQRYTLLVLLAAGAAGIVVAAIDPNVRVIAIALGAVDMALYYAAYRRVRAVKRREWWQAEHRYGVTVDTSFRTDPVRVPWLWLSPAVVVLLVTLVGGWSFEPVLAQAGVILVATLVVVLVLRSRPDLDAARPAGSARRYRIYLRGVGRMVFLLAAAVNGHLLVAAFDLPVAVGYVLLAAGILAFLTWELRVGQAGHRLPALPGEQDEDSGVVQRDDDRYWFVAGMIYANRGDPAVLVHRRVGAYWTLNLGHPVAWAVVAVVVVIAVLSGLGVVRLP